VIIEAATLPADTELTADVCIIGAGPAGLTVAQQLISSGLDVVVLESGEEDYDERTQALAGATLVGDGFRFNGAELDVAQTRLRQLGGTSNHWTGQCRPLDAHDFDQRDAVANSGWPFGADELAPYYKRAVTSCQLAVNEWAPTWWHDHTGAPILVDTDTVTTSVFQFSAPTRFGPELKPALAAAKHVRVVLGATALELQVTPDGSRVQAVTVSTLDGQHSSVKPGVVVVATGGIEPARLLLLSNGVNPAGLGNDHDVVGRYFMEHPHAIAGRARFVPSADLSFSVIGGRTIPGAGDRLVWAGLSPTAKAQADAGIGHGVALMFGAGGGSPREDREQATVPADAVDQLVTLGAGTASAPVLTVRVEQEPNPDNRVTLGDDLDGLGQRRAVVTWRMHPPDWHTVRTTIELIADALGRAGLARIEIDPSGKPIEEWPVEIGNHHMGTTRMHADPAHGVVDAQCQVHGIDNLYVCGSSVFPTSGMANPTLTIVALAHRLADHLRREVRRR